MTRWLLILSLMFVPAFPVLALFCPLQAHAVVVGVSEDDCGQTCCCGAEAALPCCCVESAPRQTPAPLTAPPPASPVRASNLFPAGVVSLLDWSLNEAPASHDASTWQGESRTAQWPAGDAQRSLSVWLN